MQNETIEIILKWLGATASFLWIPTIYPLIKRKLFDQKITVAFDKKINIFYGSQGSNLSIRIGMYTPIKSENEDVVFEKIHIKLKTPSTANLHLDILQIEDTITSKIVHSTSQESISAVHIRSDILTFLKPGLVLDKYITFNDKNFEEKTKTAWENLHALEKHFRSEGKPKSELIGTQELSKLKNEIKTQFLWQPGDYEIELIATAANKKIKLENNKISFNLSTDDIIDLEKNKHALDDIFNSILDPEKYKTPSLFFASKDVMK